MLSSAPVLVDTPASVRYLLEIREASDFRCHGITKKNPRCRNKIAAATAVTVEALLSKIAVATTQEEKRRHLNLMAPLTLCETHKGQKETLVTIWGNLVKEVDVKVDVKVEVDEEVDIKIEVDEEVDSSQEEWGAIKEDHKSPNSLISRVKVENETGSLVHMPNPSTAVKPHPDLITKHHFEPYSSPKSTLAVNEIIATMLSTPLTENSLRSTSSSGYVYIYTFTPTPSIPTRFLKIGNAAKIDSRLKQWEKQCGHTPTLLCHFETHLYRQVERIVHAQLGNERLREVHGCEGCGKKHKEWFEVKLHAAGAVLGLWTAWSLRKPYDESGVLKEEWRRKLKELDLSDARCWESFVEG